MHSRNDADSKCVLHVWVDRKKAEFTITNKHRLFTHMHILSFIYQYKLSTFQSINQAVSCCQVTFKWPWVGYKTCPISLISCDHQTVLPNIIHSDNSAAPRYRWLAHPVQSNSLNSKHNIISHQCSSFSFVFAIICDQAYVIALRSAYSVDPILAKSNQTQAGLIDAVAFTIIIIVVVVQGSNWTGTHRNGVPVLFFKTGTAFLSFFLKIPNENQLQLLLRTHKCASIRGTSDLTVE